MSSPPSAPPRRRLVRPRLARRHWLTPAVLALVLLGVWVGGGFRTAPPIGVRTYDVGQAISLQRWTIVVDRVDLVDTSSYDSPQAPALRVALTATWTGEQSTYGSAHGLVAVVVPDGPAASPDESTVRIDRYTGGFDPDLPRSAGLDFTWPVDATETSPPVAAPQEVLVVISDERPSQNFIDASAWVPTRPIGHVLAPVHDLRARR